jgi:hypothetical protein
MRRLTGKSLLGFILAIALLVLPVLLDEAYAQRGGGGGGRGGGGARVSGGGGYRGGGMGGGGFQGSVQRPTGGGGSYQASRTGAGGPQYGSTTYQKNVNVNVDNNWHGGRYGYGGVAAGVAGAAAVGTVVWAISSAARPVHYGGTTYYVDGNTYYKPCYQSDEAAYCVVKNPNP